MEEAQSFINSFGLGATFISIIAILFGKKFIEKYAEKTVEKAFNETLTRESEVIKQIFRKDLEDFKKVVQIEIAKEVEPLRAALSRENISFQIINTEFNKLKFSRLDNLYLKLNELKVFSQDNLLFATGQEEREAQRQAFFKQYKEVENAIQHAMLYVNDDVIVSAIDMLNACHSALSSFNKITVTENILQSNSGNSIAQQAALQNGQAFDQLVNTLDRLPSALREVESEFKRHILFTGIDK